MREHYKNTERYVKHSFRVLKDHGLKELVRTLHRQYVHCYYPPVTRFLPTAMEVEITTHCNLDCIMCRSSFNLFENREVKHIDPDTFSHILDHLDFLNLVSFRGAGEPAMHPRLKDLAAMVVERKKRVRISTNGMLLNRRLCKELVSVPVSEIVFSIDACKAETYSHIRKGADLDRVLFNLAALGDLVRGRNGTKLFVMFVVMRANFRELPGLLERIDGTGVSALVPKFLNPGLNADLQKQALNRAEIAEFAGILENLAATDVKVEKEGVNFIFNGSAKKNRCMNAWVSPFINIDGNVAPCPSMYYNEEVRLGSILMEDFTHIWNCDTIQRHRRDIVQDMNPFCMRCPANQ